MRVHPTFGGRWIPKYWKWLHANDKKHQERMQAKIIAICAITDELVRFSDPRLQPVGTFNLAKLIRMEFEQAVSAADTQPANLGSGGIGSKP